MSILPFLDDDIILKYTKHVLDNAIKARTTASDKTSRNVLDPFSALFAMSANGMSYQEWLAQEKLRQVQKTLENSIGDFHQGILGSMPGWEKLHQGLDVWNSEKKIVAEVKNKFNTTKGNHKVKIYDDISSALATDKYRGFTGYYVEVVPKQPGTPYDVPFVPSDNGIHERRVINEHIRRIDGYSFYGMASGYPDGLRMLYESLPEIIRRLGYSGGGKVGSDAELASIFASAYQPNRSSPSSMF